MARKCVRRKRVRVKGQGMAYRCAKFSGKSRRKSRKGYRAKRRGKRKPYGMARRGSQCLSFRRVRVRGQGWARRCRKFSQPRRRRSYSRRRAA